jgi:hypothetical protein
MLYLEDRLFLMRSNNKSLTCLQSARQCRADLGERLCAKSTKRFFDKLVNHFSALWRNLQKRKLILHNNYLLGTH